MLLYCHYMSVKEHIVKTVNYENMFYSQVVYSFVNAIKKPTTRMLLLVVGYQLWSQLGSNQRPPDYESGALTG
jgi:hypothetical protein